MDEISAFNMGSKKFPDFGVLLYLCFMLYLLIACLVSTILEGVSRLEGQNGNFARFLIGALQFNYSQSCQKCSASALCSMAAFCPPRPKQHSSLVPLWSCAKASLAGMVKGAPLSHNNVSGLQL